MFRGIIFCDNFAKLCEELADDVLQLVLPVDADLRYVIHDNNAVNSIRLLGLRSYKIRKELCKSKCSVLLCDMKGHIHVVSWVFWGNIGFDEMGKILSGLIKNMAFS